MFSSVEMVLALWLLVSLLVATVSSVFGGPVLSPLDMKRGFDKIFCFCCLSLVLAILGGSTGFVVDVLLDFELKLFFSICPEKYPRLI